MTDWKNDWNGLRKFYAAHPEIVKEAKNEWAVDPYFWDTLKLVRMTPIEAWLWSDIRGMDAVLYPQYPVGGVFVDFASPRARIAIECDGKDFHDAAADAQRDSRLADIGWTVYRFTGRECREDEGATHRRLKEICQQHGVLR